MKVGFDARMLDHPGIGRYIKNLLHNLLSLPEDNKFILYGEPQRLSDFKRYRNCSIHRDSRPIYNLNEYLFHPFKRGELDIVHIPHFNIPFAKIERLIVTVHDLIYLNFPQLRPPWLKNIAIELVIKNAVNRASKIIAVSESTRKDILERFPRIKEKIEVIYEASESLFNKIEDREKLLRVRRKYSLPQEFILFVGSLKKHKNIERLIDAFSDLKKSKNIQEELVIVGRFRPREKKILEKINSSGVFYLGEVPSEDLAGIYNLASLLVLPSLYEGFGLPVLEAQSCGLPVVLSNIATLKEIAQDSAVFVNPYKIDEIRDALYNVITNTELRNGLIIKGYRNRERFSWQETARKTLSVYREVYESCHHP